MPPSRLGKDHFPPLRESFGPRFFNWPVYLFIYLAAAVILIDPNAVVGGRSGMRAAQGFRHSRPYSLSTVDSVRLFVTRQARGAILLVIFATVLELISGGLTYLESRKSPPAAGITVFHGGTVLANLLLAFTIARLGVVTLASLRQNGTLEVLLVTPLKLKDLLQGARRMFWRTTCWPIFVLAIVHAAYVFASVPKWTRFEWEFCTATALNILMYVPYYASLFWLGSYFALSLRKPGAAVLLTLAVGLVIPTITTTLFQIFVMRWVASLLEGLPLPMWTVPAMFQILPHFVGLGIFLGLIFWARNKIQSLDLKNANGRGFPTR